VRDRWTPLFAHRHPFKQVIAWFRRCGMDYMPIDPTVYEDRMRIPLIGVGLRGVMPVSEPRSVLLLLSDVSACARAGATAAALAAGGWSVEVAAPADAVAALEVPASVRVTTANACPHLGELPNPPAVAVLRRVPWSRVAAPYESLVASASSAARMVLVAFDLPALAAAAVGATVHGTRLVYDVGESFAERPQFRQDGLEDLLLDLERWLRPYADVVTAASSALADLVAAGSGVGYPMAQELVPEAPVEQLVAILDEIADREPHSIDAAVVAAVRLRGEQLATEHATTLGIVGDLSVVPGKTLAKELARRASRRAVRGTIRRAGAIRSAVSPSARDGARPE
jgi:hypothetical protein